MSTILAPEWIPLTSKFLLFMMQCCQIRFNGQTQTISEWLHHDHTNRNEKWWRSFSSWFLFLSSLSFTDRMTDSFASHLVMLLCHYAALLCHIHHVAALAAFCRLCLSCRLSLSKCKSALDLCSNCLRLRSIKRSICRALSLWPTECLDDSQALAVDHDDSIGNNHT